MRWISGCARRAGRAAFAFFAAFLATETAAQELQGRVLLGDRPVAEAPVELHRVTRDTAGVVARGSTDDRGRFRFTVPRPDTTGFAVFFTTAEHLGVRYFGPALHPSDPRGEYVVAVYDTVAAAGARDAIRVSRRDIVVLPDPRTGGWEVNEVLQLRNTGERTLVSLEGLPTWEFRLPAHATAFELGEGEIAASDVVRMEDRVLLLMPLVPGERDLFLRYRVPAATGELRIAFDSPTDTVNVYVRQPSPSVAVEGLAAGEPVRVEGEEFLSYHGAGFAAASAAILAWSDEGPPVSPRTAALALVGLLLASGGFLAIVRRDRGDTGTVERDGPIAREPDEPVAPAS